MYKIRELDPILDKEYRRIIRYQIEVTFIRIKLGGKTTDITYRIC